MWGIAQFSHAGGSKYIFQICFFLSLAASTDRQELELTFLTAHYRVHKPPFTENSLQYQFTVNIIMTINGPKWTWQPQKGYVMVMVIVVLGIWRNEKVYDHVGQIKQLYITGMKRFT